MQVTVVISIIMTTPVTWGPFEGWHQWSHTAEKGNWPQCSEVLDKALLRAPAARSSTQHLTIGNILWVRLCERVQVTSAIHRNLLTCLPALHRTWVSLEWPCDMASDMEREGPVRITFPKWRRRGCKAKPLSPVRLAHPPPRCLEPGLMLDSGVTNWNYERGKTCAQWLHVDNAREKLKKESTLWVFIAFSQPEHLPVPCAHSIRHKSSFLCRCISHSQ